MGNPMVWIGAGMSLAALYASTRAIHKACIECEEDAGEGMGWFAVALLVFALIALGFSAYATQHGGCNV